MIRKIYIYFNFQKINIIKFTNKFKLSDPNVNLKFHAK